MEVANLFLALHDDSLKLRMISPNVHQKFCLILSDTSIQVKTWETIESS